ncbi:hypothetical protein H2203_004161 [Taxawa tesnikishii (nom. ined.)]|nr:hypothetical protein H2203_004161 [Dothideales sp. JES 119]
MHAHRRSAQHLVPDPDHYSGGRQRASSTGASPRPEINIVNEIMQDAALRSDQRNPPGAFPSSPPLRGRTGRLGDALAAGVLAEELAELRLDRRARSRGRSDAGFRDGSPGWYQWELAQKEKELQALAAKSAQEAEYKRREDAYKYKRLQEDMERKRREDEEEREHKRLIDEYERKKLKADLDRKKQQEEEEAEHKRLIAEYEKKRADAEKKRKDEEEVLRLRIAKEKADAEAKQAALIKQVEADKAAAAAKQKAAEQALLDRIERERKAAKEKEEREYAEFLAKQKAKKEAEDKKKKEEEDKFEAEMKKRLARFGFQNNQIEAMVDPQKKADQIKQGRVPGNALAVRQPIYSKVHREYLDVDTLRYYEIPYEYDRANPDYIIILREMDKYETEVLFEHTRRLRKGRLLIEEPSKKKKNEYAFVRRRSRSKSTGRKERRIEVVEIARR